MALADPAPGGGDAPAPQTGAQPSKQSDDPDRWWAIQVQATDVFQYKPAMRSPYQGTNSLPGA